MVGWPGNDPPHQPRGAGFARALGSYPSFLSYS
jgi:hypothetical protein